MSNLYIRRLRDNIHVTVLYCIVLYCIVLYCIVLYCIVLYCIEDVTFNIVAKHDLRVLL